jgi:hypothetical protein
MRKSLIVFMSAAMLAGTALTGSAIARDRGDVSDAQTDTQIANKAEARIAQLKVDLNLTADQEKNWASFASAMQDMTVKQAKRRTEMRNERSQRESTGTVGDSTRREDTGTVDVLDEVRKHADSQIERSNDRKKFADAAQPLYATLNDQQKRRFAEELFGGSHEPM